MAGEDAMTNQEVMEISPTTERLVQALPAAFSLALIALSLVANPLFIGQRQVNTPWYLAMLLIGSLGMTIHIASRHQRRRIEQLKRSMELLQGPMASRQPSNNSLDRTREG
jgi:hypothetical protein